MFFIEYTDREVETRLTFTVDNHGYLRYQQTLNLTADTQFGIPANTVIAETISDNPWKPAPSAAPSTTGPGVRSRPEPGFTGRAFKPVTPSWTHVGPGDRTLRGGLIRENFANREQKAEFRGKEGEGVASL